MTSRNYDKIYDPNDSKKICLETSNQTSSKFQKIFRDIEEKQAPLTKEDGKEILEAIAKIERKLELIFGDTVFIKGRIVSFGDLKDRV